MNFKPRNSFAGALEPGDSTHYEMVLVEQWDVYEVVVLNDDFFDKLTFLKHDCSFTIPIEASGPILVPS